MFNWSRAIFCYGNRWYMYYMLEVIVTFPAVDKLRDMTKFGTACEESYTHKSQFSNGQCCVCLAMVRYHNEWYENPTKSTSLWDKRFFFLHIPYENRNRHMLLCPLVYVPTRTILLFLVKGLLSQQTPRDVCEILPKLTMSQPPWLKSYNGTWPCTHSKPLRDIHWSEWYQVFLKRPTSARFFGICSISLKKHAVFFIDISKGPISAWV
jgi:hypothetical protein